VAETIMLFAIPAFFALIGLEIAVAWWRGRAVYRVNDAIASLSLGTLSQLSGLFSKALTVGLYALVVKHAALFELSTSTWWVWLAALLLYDFLYYWYHRFGHEVALLWAAHVVHHQSERYNLSTALRQTSTGALVGSVFYLPMALLGFPVAVFAVVAVIDLLYQFWIHTELVGKLGWFDRVFASPSNHRAHHAVNERYLDRNYGGLFILWDRLFGTFVEECDDDPPVYGTRSPLRSFNPLWANAEVYVALWRQMRLIEGWGDKLRLWFKHPGWLPPALAARTAAKAFDLNRPEYHPLLSRGLTAYATVQFALLLVPAVLVLMQAAQWRMPITALAAALITGQLLALGWLLEGRRPIALEAGRLVLALLLVGLLHSAVDHPGVRMLMVGCGVLQTLGVRELFFRLQQRAP
jgi:sterol desaturase/sphingolipid hydroxylase (fatty acid hydroxylase superfamily)